MLSIHRTIWLILAVSVSITGLVPLADSASAQAPATVRIGSSTVAPGQSTTVLLDVVGVTNLGAATIDVVYDAAVLDATACAPASGFDSSLCNVSYAADTVRFTGISATGRSGDFALADITFQAIGTAGQSSALTLTSVTFADTNGGDIANTTQNGSINIVAPATSTPTAAPGTPTPTPPRSATPPPSPASVPITGGDSPSSSSVSEWAMVLLAGAGLAAIAASGWAIKRGRRR